MNALDAGLLCTLLLIGTVAALLGGMSAARRRRRAAFALCLAVAAPDFALLSVLLARLPDCETLAHAPLWTAAALTSTALSLLALCLMLRGSRRQLSPFSIKESCDHLPSALCFAWENGQPCLKNLKMDELSHQLTGEALLNANTFWRAIEAQPIVSLENGQTWSFERRRMEMAGRVVYQIIGTNITEEARLRHVLEKDNLRLKAMNRRLRQYGQDVQRQPAKRRFCAPKPASTTASAARCCKPGSFFPERRATRRLSAPRGGRTPGFCWGNPSRNSGRIPLNSSPGAAKAIGVTIARSGSFPEEGTENAQLVEAAAHECLTNLVRHAGGTRLEIFGEKTASAWKVRYLNDGAVPTAPIVEGSGLTALRMRTEAAGGAMEIAVLPRFQLTLILQRERQAME